MTDVEDTLHTLFVCEGAMDLVFQPATLRLKCEASGEFRDANPSAQTAHANHLQTAGANPC